VRNDLDLSVTNLGDLNGLTEVANTAVNLDLVLEELLEGGDVEDLVAGGLRSVDDELIIPLATALWQPLRFLEREDILLRGPLRRIRGICIPCS